MERVNNTFRYELVQFGPPRKGEFRTDGTPANSDTTVFPVRVQAQHTIEFPDGQSRTEPKDIKAVFFNDDLGDWTWTIK
jgi:hypothetical protein